MGQLLTVVQQWVLGYTLGGDVFSASGKGVHRAGVHPIQCCVLGHRVLGC